MHWASLGSGREGAGASQKAASRGGKGGAGESKEIAIISDPPAHFCPSLIPAIAHCGHRRVFIFFPRVHFMVYCSPIRRYCYE